MVEQLLSYKILRTDLRDYIVRRVKDPMRKGLILLANRLPAIDRGNTRFKNTHILMGIFDKFLELQNHDMRTPLFKAFFKVFLMEIEHDIYYRDRFNWFLEELIKEILKGNWEERTNGQPSTPTWKETGNYGGKYSIMKVLQRAMETGDMNPIKETSKW